MDGGQLTEDKGYSYQLSVVSDQVSRGLLTARPPECKDEG